MSIESVPTGSTEVVSTGSTPIRDAMVAVNAAAGKPSPFLGQSLGRKSRAAKAKAAKPVGTSAKAKVAKAVKVKAVKAKAERKPARPKFKSEAELSAKYPAIVPGTLHLDEDPASAHYHKMVVTIRTRVSPEGKFDGGRREVATSDLFQCWGTPEARKAYQAEQRALQNAAKPKKAKAAKPAKASKAKASKKAK